MKYPIALILSMFCICYSVTIAQMVPPLPGIRMQGTLTDNGGNLITGSHDITIRIYKVPTGGLPIYAEYFGGIVFSNGILDLMVNSTSLRYDSLYWVETQLDNEVFSPRVQLASVPYAFRALRSDSAYYASPIGMAGGALSGNYPNPGIANNAVTSAKIEDSTIQFLDLGRNGASTGQVIKWNGTAWIATGDDNGTGTFLPLSGGAMTGAITNSGNPTITMGKGNFGTGNFNTGVEAFVAGSNNRARGGYSTVAGGGGESPSDSNSAIGDYSAIGGGYRNTASGGVATIGGGINNVASGSTSTIGGGIWNTASEPDAVVSGGFSNNSNAPNATIGGGTSNSIMGPAATIGGGAANTANGHASTITGGSSNTTLGSWSVIGGGSGNSARADYSSIAGGSSNRTYGRFSVISGGGGSGSDSNATFGEYSNIAGGRGNLTNDSASSIGGGASNSVSGKYSAIGGGQGNSIVTNYSVIGGGQSNSTVNLAHNSVIAGGVNNQAIGKHGSIGGGYSNVTGNWSDGGWYATIAGGQGNIAEGWHSFVGGGANNQAGTYTPNGGATVGGGSGNRAFAISSTITGGYNNVIDGGVTGGTEGFIGGGQGNRIRGPNSTIGGGSGNLAGFGNYLLYFADGTTIGGGISNVAVGGRSTVAGGELNIAGQFFFPYDPTYSSVGGGLSNSSTGNYATIPGGRSNSASGGYAFASGWRAKASHNGSFVWADSTDSDFNSERVNQFTVRSGGGAKFTVGSAKWLEIRDSAGYSLLTTSTGAYLTHTGVWQNSSDMNKKENIQPVDRREILRKLEELPISIWNFKGEERSVRHVGPMAQDFHALFGLGNDNRTISTIDPAGVALAAIQELTTENTELRKRLEKLESLVESLTRQSAGTNSSAEAR